MERVVSFGGLFMMMGLAWAMSTDRKKINCRIVAGGLALQFGLALLVLKTERLPLAFCRRSFSFRL